MKERMTAIGAIKAVFGPMNPDELKALSLEARERKLKSESPVDQQIRAASQKIWDRLHPEGVHQ